ncbi:MAG: TIGR04283 family arsenosugar biosynthesis glycosyltransferase [Planctomycetota bacterium]
MTPSDISVIVPAINEATLVKKAIESAIHAGAREVVVCDGGSDDDTVEVASGAGATVCASKPGRGQQLRRGAEEATGRYLLFLHADNTLGPDCLREICRAVESSDAEFVWGGFRQQIADQRRIYRWLERGNAARIIYRGMPFGDQAMFVSRRAYDQVGGIETVPLMEDVRLSRSLRRLAWPVLLDGPVHVSPRRWQQRGVVGQTARNWWIQLAHRFGVQEDRLSVWYHDK